MESYNNDDAVIGRIIAWAAGNDLIRAVLLEGSRGNPSATIDEFSDYDIAIVVSDLAPFVERLSWIEWFGEPIVHWGDRRMIDGIEYNTRLVMYEGGTRIDYQAWRPEAIRAMVERGRLPAILDTGYRVLLDKDGITKGLPPATYTAHTPPRPAEAEFLALVNDFWWETLYVAKNLRRDELFPARWSLDAEMKHDMLRRMLEWRVEIEHGWSIRPGNHGSGLKQRLQADLWCEIEQTFAGADADEIWAALWTTIRVFRRVAAEVGGALGYAYPHDLDRRVTAYLTSMQPGDRDNA